MKYVVVVKMSYNTRESIKGKRIITEHCVSYLDDRVRLVNEVITKADQAKNLIGSIVYKIHIYNPKWKTKDEKIINTIIKTMNNYKEIIHSHDRSAPPFLLGNDKLGSIMTVSFFLVEPLNVLPFILQISDIIVKHIDINIENISSPLNKVVHFNIDGARRKLESILNIINENS